MKKAVLFILVIIGLSACANDRHMKYYNHSCAEISAEIAKFDKQIFDLMEKVNDGNWLDRQHAKRATAPQLKMLKQERNVAITAMKENGCKPQSLAP
ncbi:MAG: hypothetical protein LBQ75_06885 [Zoogloeaceae bacterium]|nr:hypothetical protein [Zoogloeaceae bacterium]